MNVKRFCGCLAGFCLCGVLLSGCVVRKHEPSHEEFEAALEAHNAEAEPRDRIVCRREQVVGSHFKERVCRYQWQLEQGNLDGRAQLDDILRRTENVQRPTP